MVDSALTQIKAFAATADEPTRQSIRASLRKLADSLERPDETVHRHGSLVLQTAIVEVGFELGLFRYLTKAACGPLTVDDLSKATGAERGLLGRLLRYLASAGVIDEVARQQYVANHLSRTFATEMAEAGMRHYFYTCGPLYQTIPAFLKKTGHTEPNDPMHTVHQDAFNSDKDVYGWLGDQPELLAYFNDFMALRRAPEMSWLSVYPIEEETKGWIGEKALFVDIGGNIGHQCASLRAAHPCIPGRVILQDIPAVVAHAFATPGVENMVHDFSKPQPIAGAKFYYIRHVLHNQADHKAQEVLRHTKAAMGPDSVLLVDEMILPEMGVNIETASIDLTMMAACAAKERTLQDWRVLIEGAGLRLVKTYVYNVCSYEGVMDIRLP